MTGAMQKRHWSLPQCPSPNLFCPSDLWHPYFSFTLSLYYIIVFIQPWYPCQFTSTLLPQKINFYLFFSLSWYHRKRCIIIKGKEVYTYRQENHVESCVCGKYFEKTLVSVWCWRKVVSCCDVTIAIQHREWMVVWKRWRQAEEACLQEGKWMEYK